VNLALALASKGAIVGVLDADLYGPSIGTMIAVDTPLSEKEGSIIPAQGLGLFVVSLGYFLQPDQATIVRAPIANQMITELLMGVSWPDLDYLLIDFPPGTGDIQLTLMQQTCLSGAILVTTPQEVALLDVAKAYRMFQQMNVPVLGLVENMSYFKEGEALYYPFGQGGGSRFAKKWQIPMLGEIPITESVSFCADHGISLLSRYPESIAAKTFIEVGDKVELALVRQVAQEKEGLRSFTISLGQGG